MKLPPSYVEDGCDEKYRLRELDLTFTRLTSEGLQFGQVQDPEDLRKCLGYALVQVLNLAVRSKRSSELDMLAGAESPFSQNSACN